MLHYNLLSFKPTKCTFRNERDEKLLVITIMAWDFGVSRPLRPMGFYWFTGGGGGCIPVAVLPSSQYMKNFGITIA